MEKRSVIKSYMKIIHTLSLTLLFLLSLTLLSPVSSAAMVKEWGMYYSGPADLNDVAKSIAVDASGNVYVTGYSTGSGTSSDYFTIKYNAAGTLQWGQRYNGTGSSSDEATAIAVDASGNVYVTGYSTGSGSGQDYYTIKYGPDGAVQWGQRYNGTGSSSDSATAITVDASGNVYITGYSTGAGTSTDYYTIKYDSTGTLQWGQRYNGTGSSSDSATAIAVDASGNVYVTGYSTGTGTFTDYFTIKYNAAGTLQWGQRYNGTGSSYDEATAIAVDASGNVYITGYSTGLGTSTDYFTIKYDPAGTVQWGQGYNGTGNSYDKSTDIAVDASGNVYVTGYSTGPGTSTDYFTIKYDPAGAAQWEDRFNGTGNLFDSANAISCDAANNIYITGYSTGSTNNYDYYTIKYVPEYTLSVSRSGTGSGTVSSSPPGINCGIDCTEDLKNTTTVTLTATPDSGSVFAGWSGDADCSDGVVTMDSAKSCTATFTINHYALDILISGTGSGAVTSAPAGIDCGADCTEYYAYNTVVTLTAATDTGSTFIGWDGGGCSGIGTCRVTMTAAASVTAAFDSMYQPAYQLTTSVSPAGHGSMTPDCSGGCQYDSGTVVVFTAEEDNGYPFSNWLGCDAPSGNTCTMTVDTDRSVTAAFDSCQYPVRTSSYYYSLFQDAYDDAVPGDTIQSRGMDFFEDIFIDQDKTVTITGGYDCDYTAVTGKTTINGNMITSSGMVMIRNGTIELR